mgnify:CR=1 FL=1
MDEVLDHAPPIEAIEKEVEVNSILNVVPRTTKPHRGIYTSGYAKKCYELMRNHGMSPTEVAAELGISRRIIYYWAKDTAKEEFVEAFERGMTAYQAYHEKLLRNLITGKVKGSAPIQLQSNARRFRSDWGETVKNEVKVTNAAEGMSKEELDKQVISLLQKKR